MMHNNEHYNYWGMHMGWWLFMLVVLIAIVWWVMWSRKGNKKHN